MGLLDNLSGAVKGLAGQLETAALPALLSAALAKTDLKDMQGLLDKLQQSGLGPQVSLVTARTYQSQRISLGQRWAMRRSNR
jgi:uncharacterized protein YidB (DUF937 family)